MATAARFKTGNAPGSPKHTGHVFIFGGSPNFVVQEYSKADEQRAEAFPGTLKRQGGYLPVPDAPGLGVRIDDARLAAFARPMVNPNGLLMRTDGSVAYAV